MHVSLSAITHPGLERENNEDAFVLCPDVSNPHWSQDTKTVRIPLGDLGTLLLVADGIGGFNAGEVASSIAVHTAISTFTTQAANQAFGSVDKQTELLRHVISRADEAIKQQVLNDFHLMGMGTTIVMAWILPSHTHIAWCGDSRCYLYHVKEGLRTLTEDHSYVQTLIAKGEITSTEAMTHPDNNIITRALGDVDCPSEPEVITIPTQPDTTLLLCTDGLCGYVSDDIIQKTLSHNYRQPHQCCDSLLRLALSTGGYDNVAIAVAHVSNSGPSFLSRVFHF